MEPSKKDMISVVFLLVFGASFAVLGVINLFGLSGEYYVGGLMLILMSISFTKYKTYAKYYVPTILICGVIVTIIGLNLAFTVHDYLIYAIGLGVLTGGIGNLIVVLAGRKHSGTNRVGGET